MDFQYAKRMVDIICINIHKNRTQDVLDSDNQKSVDPEELADQYAILHVTLFTNRTQDGPGPEKQKPAGPEEVAGQLPEGRAG